MIQGEINLRLHTLLSEQSLSYLPNSSLGLLRLGRSCWRPCMAICMRDNVKITQAPRLIPMAWFLLRAMRSTKNTSDSTNDLERPINWDIDFLEILNAKIVDRMGKRQLGNLDYRYSKIKSRDGLGGRLYSCC